MNNNELRELRNMKYLQSLLYCDMNNIAIRTRLRMKDTLESLLCNNIELCRQV